MPQTPGIRKTVPQKLLELFKGVFGDDFHGYYEGDPIIFPASMLPAIVVSEPETDSDVGPTGMDQDTHHILIQVVFDKKDDLGKPDNAATLENKVDSIAQGRDETTGQYIEKSIKGIIRKNLTLDGIIVNSVGSVRKGVVPRSETLTTVEAHVEATMEELIVISGRT